MEPVKEGKDLYAGIGAGPELEVVLESEAVLANEDPHETGVVRETLSEVLAKAEPSFTSATAAKTGP